MPLSTPVAKTSKGAPARSPPRHVRSILAFLAALAAIDFIVPDLLHQSSPDNVFLVGLVLGALAGQPLLLSVWAVFGPWRFWRRWLTSLAAAACLYAIFLAGMWIAEESPGERQDFAVNLLFLPFVFLCAQFPLWLLRLALGRGLSHEDDPPDGEERGVQFRTRDALTAIALIGLSLGLARVAVLLHDVDTSSGGMQPWIGLASVCAVAGLWSATALLPCVWATFLTRNRFAATLAVIAYVLIAAESIWTVVAIAVDSAVVGDVMVMLFAVHAGLLTLVLLGCHKIRSWGYALQR